MWDISQKVLRRFQADARKVAINLIPRAFRISRIRKGIARHVKKYMALLGQSRELTIYGTARPPAKFANENSMALLGQSLSVDSLWHL